MKKRRIGIYGGKFDPPHVGHALCAEMTREAFDLETVLFVVSANPPHKDSGVTPAKIRLRMVQAMVAPNCYFEACDIEMKREGKSFTYDTVVALRKKYGPDVELCLMMSSEYLDPEHPWYLKTKWDKSAELVKMVRLLIFCRAGHTVEMAKKWAELIPGAQVEFLDFCPTPPVSSTILRDRVAEGQSIWYMVLPEVWQVIRDLGLYGCKLPPRGSFALKTWRRLKVIAQRIWYRI